MNIVEFFEALGKIIIALLEFYKFASELVDEEGKQPGELETVIVPETETQPE